MSNLALLAFTATQDELKKDILFKSKTDNFPIDILTTDEELCAIDYGSTNLSLKFLNKITKEALVRIFFNDPELKYREKYIFQEKNDLRNGFFTEYYENGMLKVETEAYINGKLEGIVKEYYPNGNLRHIFQFKNDRINGLQQIYSENYNNLLISEEIYEDEIIKTIFEYDPIIEDDIVKSYLSKKADFYNGKVHGECIEYFPNRNIKEITIYYLGNEIVMK
jgi:antitoxin component YwqK of YwqJK toxin-antitoxin module